MSIDYKIEKSVSIRILGKVQGVWFRSSVKNEAEKLGLYGFVRNEPDKSVYIEASGTIDKINLLVHWCHSGPQFARVEDVHVQDIDEHHAEQFRIL
jgi:acylphosphatase